MEKTEQNQEQQKKKRVKIDRATLIKRIVATMLVLAFIVPTIASAVIYFTR